jgi:hypothetical protein
MIKFQEKSDPARHVPFPAVERSGKHREQVRFVTQ